MKLKTHQATAKKIKITGAKRGRKFMTKRAGQDHFNARDSGNITRSKRRRQQMDPVSLKTAQRLMPYS